jgi:hypothetical protein
MGMCTFSQPKTQGWASRQNLPTSQQLHRALAAAFRRIEQKELNEKVADTRLYRHLKTPSRFKYTRSIESGVNWITGPLPLCLRC